MEYKWNTIISRTNQSTKDLFDSIALNEDLAEEETYSLTELNNTFIRILYIISVKSHQTCEKDKKLWFTVKKENSQWIQRD